MDVKGTAFLARKLMLVEDIGEGRYEEFLAEFARREPVFAEPIHATTHLPLQAFVAFNEALVNTFYGGDPGAYFRFGEKSAEYALIIGPYKRIRDTSSVAAFVEAARFIYQGYYTAGRAEGCLEGNTAELKLHGIPPEHRHLYLEYAIAGYVRRGIELVSLRSVHMERVAGFSCGDDLVHYHYVIEGTPAPAPVVARFRAS
ncbi:MAG: hypothetical protein R3F14_29420 [Polyangiaceae bacterium]